MIASLGANRKEKSDGTSIARVLHDGSNCIAVNKRTRVRDQERRPMASDLKRATREKAKRGETTFALTADVKEAHRQIPVARGDWRLLGCRVRSCTYVYINTVGTFGASSASYCWSRIGSGIGSLMQYIVGQSATTWIMSVADEYHLETSGAAYWTGLSLSLSSSSSESRSRGRRRLVGTPSHGWVSNCTTSPVNWASPNAVPNGFADGFRNDQYFFL